MYGERNNPEENNPPNNPPVNPMLQLEDQLGNLQIQNPIGTPNYPVARNDFALHKLDKINYIIWKRHTQNVLEAKDLWKVVSGQEQNLNKEIQARALLTSALSAENQMRVICCNDAKSIWQRLERIHENKSTFERQSLLAKLFSYKIQSARDIAKAFAELEMLRAKLTMLGENVSDEVMMTVILKGLPSQFSTFIQIWRNTPATERTFNELLTRIMAEMADEDQPSEKVLFTQPKGRFNKKGGFKGKPRFNKNRGKPGGYSLKDTNGQLKKCEFCHKNGHIKADCYSFRRTQNNNKEGQQNSNKGANKPTYHPNSSQNKPNHSKDGPVEVLVAESSTVTTWIIDGGSACHLCNNLNWLSEYEEYDQPK